jgi:hypothetical protein
MNADALAKHYGNLTPEERFRLILAAGGRGDKAEQDRLVSSGQRIPLSVQDHAPYAHAFDEVALLIFLELLEEAARYLDTFARSDVADDLGGDDEAADGGEADEAEGDSGEDEPSEAKAAAESATEDAGKPPLWQRYLDLALAAGFVMRTKAEGWKRFCERLAVPPFALWESLPGFDRLQRALKLAEEAAFFPEGLLRWLNTIRPAGAPELAEVPLTVEGIATATEEFFRQRVQWWGG